MTMLEIMESIFGVYAPVDGLANWQYIGGVLIFCIVLWSAFALLGGVLKR